MAPTTFSRARLIRMRDTLSGHVERGQVPGLVSLVSRRGEVHVNAMGSLALHGEPVRRDSIFRISSMSKAVTAVAAMILVEECELRLDDPVEQWLPELANRRVLRRFDSPLDDTVPARRSITVRDLLTFRLGMGLGLAPPGSTPIQQAMQEMQLGQGLPAPARVVALEEWIRRLGMLPLMHQPGERWMYHTGSDVLGVLIDRAADQPFEAFLRERIFEPLGMKDTGFFVPDSKIDRFATSYLTDATTGALSLHDEAEGGQWSRRPAFAGGGEGLVSTADDFLAFSLMLMNKGRHGANRILSRSSVEAMVTDQLTLEQKAATAWPGGYFDNHGWGFGVGVCTRRTDPAEPEGCFGWDGGLGTAWRCDPQEDLVTVLMTQAVWASPAVPAVVQDFRTLAYAAIDD
ncbi:serine hydrolase domain-containing protein [Piscinibacter terrae]|uniref:Class A beta-lactamase-related serine hydrolase n=1 Tax=Piscinibacter terrae TaxID=2496871 RepID=A0A3N7HX65_9BURK|nr:serine hydrolase domain-containing protein [Albitalea terrae]RQP26036.1 class A beta-lactamase-related serine hydrolase [Albitalea terrae]